MGTNTPKGSETKSYPKSRLKQQEKKKIKERKQKNRYG
jgi:hypothetical protein